MRINNNVNAKGAVKLEEIPSHLYKSKAIVFDLSFPCALCSCRVNGFDNFLKDEHDFVSKFTEVLKITNDLSGHSLHELINGSKFRHCHVVDERKQEVAQQAIRKLIKNYAQDDNIAESMYNQTVGGETLYQMGQTGATRLIGIYSGNIFRLLLADYYHNLHKDAGYNIRTKTTYNYSFESTH